MTGAGQPGAAAAVVVPVLDEADNLPALLDDLAAQEPPAAEIVVVGAGSTDGTQQLLAERARRWPVLRWLERRGANPGAGRNAGIEASRSPIVATVDAGSRVGPRWLAALTAPVVADPGRAIAVGISRSDARSPFEEAAGWFTLRAFKPPDRAAPLAARFLPAGRNGYCFARELWQAAGGYPPELRWGEDKLFFRGLVEDGAEVVVVPDAVVRWRPRRSIGELYRQYEGYGRGDALARVDRQNEIVPLVLYASGTALAVAAAAGSRPAGVALRAGAALYFGAFTASAAREVPGRALPWVPVIRLAADVAKIHGFVAVSLRRGRR